MPPQAGKAALRRPISAARRKRRQRRGQFIGFAAARAVDMRIGHIGLGIRPGKARADKAADMRKSLLASGFTQGVVIKAFEHMALFDAAAQAVVEIVLRPVVHHPIAA